MTAACNDVVNEEKEQWTYIVDQLLVGFAKKI